MFAQIAMVVGLSRLVRMFTPSNSKSPEIVSVRLPHHDPGMALPLILRRGCHDCYCFRPPCCGVDVMSPHSRASISANSAAQPQVQDPGTPIVAVQTCAGGFMPPVPFPSPAGTISPDLDPSGFRRLVALTIPNLTLQSSKNDELECERKWQIPTESFSE
jgi:hypothetical protein